MIFLKHHDFCLWKASGDSPSPSSLASQNLHVLALVLPLAVFISNPSVKPLHAFSIVSLFFLEICRSCLLLREPSSVFLWTTIMVLPSSLLNHHTFGWHLAPPWCLQTVPRYITCRRIFSTRGRPYFLLIGLKGLQERQTFPWRLQATSSSIFKVLGSLKCKSSDFTTHYFALLSLTVLPDTLPHLLMTLALGLLSSSPYHLLPFLATLTSSEMARLQHPVISIPWAAQSPWAAQCPWCFPSGHLIHQLLWWLLTAF